MLSSKDTQMHSFTSSLMTNDDCHDEVFHRLSVTSKLNQQRNIHFPHSTVFLISLYKNHLCESQKKFSVDTALLSYAFLIRLIDRAFNLHSNFTIQSRENITIEDDFDLDGCLMSQSEGNNFEFLVYSYEIDDWCIIEDGLSNENFDLIEIEHDCIIVTVTFIHHRQETFLQKATNWFHGSVQKNSLTKKEFLRMFDPSTGRLLNEETFRQRIYTTGCEPRVRKIVWCYLFRIFDQTMMHKDKLQYIIKAKERYNEMKQTWQSKQENEILRLTSLIEKDVTRTDSSVKFFDSKKNFSRERLLNILMTYCVYHPESGYAQGMTDMAAPILYVIRDEALAYACFCALMRYMSPLFHSNGVAVNRRLDLLRKTIRAIDIELWKKIEQCDTDNLMFAYRWVLLDCKREFPFKDILRVFESLWASLPIDRLELNNNCDSDIDDLCPSSLCSDRHLSILSSISNTILSSYSCSSTAEDFQSECSSTDERDSGYRDEQTSSVAHSNLNSSKEETMTITSLLPLEKWLKDFATIDNVSDYSNMFSIFLCMALLEQNRSSILQLSTSNVDKDDYIGFYFSRLVRQNDAKQALKLARHYHQQYVSFQMRMKQFVFTNHH